MSKISGERLQQFNRLLSQQLEAAKAELANKSATKRWLKEQRRFDNGWDED